MWPLRANVKKIDYQKDRRRSFTDDRFLPYSKERGEYDYKADVEKRQHLCQGSEGFTFGGQSEGHALLPGFHLVSGLKRSDRSRICFARCKKTPSCFLCKDKFQDKASFNYIAATESFSVFRSALEEAKKIFAKTKENVEIDMEGAKTREERKSL